NLAATQQKALRKLGAPPTVPADLEGSVATYLQFRTELDGVSDATAFGAIADLGAKALSEHLRSLADDQATLFKIPELQRLRAALRARGLGALVEELEGRNVTSPQAVEVLEF